jgi:hypothetical protein
VQDRLMTPLTPLLRRGAGRLLTAALLSAVLMSAFAAQADAQASRTWISGVGDDANPCSRTAPCKTLAGAISKTAAAGEINAIDPGGFGAVTITKSITIDLTTTGRGGVLTSATNAITVNAGVNDNVTLRGLEIHNAGACASTNGVNVLGANSVRIEDSTIAQYNNGVRVAPSAAAGDPSVLLNRVELTNNCATGVIAEPLDPRTTNVAVRDSTITNSGTAIRALAGAHVWVSGSTIFDNALAFAPVGTGAIESYADNRVFGNTSNGTPTATLNAGTAPLDPAPGPAGPSGPAGPAGPAGPQGAPAYKLLVAIPSTGLKAKSGKAVKLGYLATTDAATVLEIRKGSKLIKTVQGRAKTGKNTISWNGKIGKKRAPAGRYKLTLKATSTDGQTASGSASLTVGR